MKKLIVAAASVCAAALSQAATFSWGVNDIQKSDGTGIGEGYLVYFMESATTSYDNALAALTKGDTSFVSGAKWSGAADEEGIVSQKKLGSFSAGESLTGYAVVLDSTTTPDTAKNYILLGEQTVTVPDNGGNIKMSFGSLASTAYSPLSSSPDPIPEPTSGLMLLVGMAGLALKRKRA